jgi:hypothetical protein
MKTGLIPAENAMIVWKEEKDQKNEKILFFTTDVKVYFYPSPKDFEEGMYHDDFDYESHISKLGYRYAHYNMSSGCCTSSWMENGEQYRIAEAMRILTKEDLKDKSIIKKAIFEFGKIKEFKFMRLLYYWNYLSNDMTFDGLMNSYYDLDFCDGH